MWLGHDEGLGLGFGFGFGALISPSATEQWCGYASHLRLAKPSLVGCFRVTAVGKTTHPPRCCRFLCQLPWVPPYSATVLDDDLHKTTPPRIIVRALHAAMCRDGQL